MTAPSILHADLDAFYASVEQRDDPSLRGRPVIVGTGVVLAASYEAKARGIYTTMNGREARRACPEAAVVPPRMETYSKASKAVYEIFNDTAPVVEGISIDEAFLEVGGMEHISGTPPEIAAALRKRVLAEAGLPISVGVARTKFLAKVASGAAKPDGLLVVEPDREQAFLHPLPIQALWGVGKVTTSKLNGLGIRTVGDVARTSRVRLAAVIGESAAAHLADLANGRDPRPVQPRERRKSIGAQSAFPRGSRDRNQVDSLAAALVDRTARRLRAAGRACRTVSIGLRFDDFSRASRARTLPFPTDQTETVLAAVRELFDASGEEIAQKGLTLIGISLGNLEKADTVQMELPLSERESKGGIDNSALDQAVDDVRSRFGEDVIKRASMIDADQGTAVPTLPD
ncbi:MAG: DNA polymerase IV [Solirubrobacterales bacterium]|nr:DNA polymerase IV [Solirubrobacterales bacterium]OJU93341.1 MAG: DNA polymerase IV [Solirubrobacterales bacterium 67-14]